MPPKRCSAKECSSNGVHNSDAPMFKFPRDLDRCGTWVKNTGNEKLLKTPSRRLCVRKYLCADHFEENQFFDKFRRRLKRHAIPTVFPCAPLSDELMSKFPVLEDSELLGPTADDEPSYSTLSVICNKYNSFPLPCSKEISKNTDCLKRIQPVHQKNQIDKVERVKNPPEDDSCVTRDSTVVVCEQEEENHPSIIKIPSESSTNGVNSLLPGPGSITYIEGPWSKPTEEDKPISIEIYETCDVEVPKPLLLNGRHVEEYGDEPFQEIIVHHVDLSAKENTEPTPCQSLKAPSTDVNTNLITKGVQCSDSPITESDQIPPDIENLLSSSSSTIQRHFVLQSKQLANGGQVRVIYSVPETFKH